MKELARQRMVKSAKARLKRKQTKEIVKGDTEQIEAYKVKCNEVKTMWAKDMEPITLHEYYKRKGVQI